MKKVPLSNKEEPWLRVDWGSYSSNINKKYFDSLPASKKQNAKIIKEYASHEEAEKDYKLNIKPKEVASQLSPQLEPKEVAPQLEPKKVDPPLSPRERYKLQFRQQRIRQRQIRERNEIIEKNNKHARRLRKSLKIFSAQLKLQSLIEGQGEKERKQKLKEESIKRREERKKEFEAEKLEQQLIETAEKANRIHRELQRKNWRSHWESLPVRWGGKDSKVNINNSKININNLKTTRIHIPLVNRSESSLKSDIEKFLRQEYAKQEREEKKRLREEKAKQEREAYLNRHKEEIPRDRQKVIDALTKKIGPLSVKTLQFIHTFKESSVDWHNTIPPFEAGQDSRLYKEWDTLREYRNDIYRATKIKGQQTPFPEYTGKEDYRFVKDLKKPRKDKLTLDQVKAIDKLTKDVKKLSPRTYLVVDWGNYNSIINVQNFISLPKIKRHGVKVIGNFKRKKDAVSAIKEYSQSLIHKNLPSLQVRTGGKGYINLILPNAKELIKHALDMQTRDNALIPGINASDLQSIIQDTSKKMGREELARLDHNFRLSYNKTGSDAHLFITDPYHSRTPVWEAIYDKNKHLAYLKHLGKYVEITPAIKRALDKGDVSVLTKANNVIPPELNTPSETLPKVNKNGLVKYEYSKRLLENMHGHGKRGVAFKSTDVIKTTRTWSKELGGSSTSIRLFWKNQSWNWGDPRSQGAWAKKYRIQAIKQIMQDYQKNPDAVQKEAAQFGMGFSGKPQNLYREARHLFNLMGGFSLSNDLYAVASREELSTSSKRAIAKQALAIKHKTSTGEDVEPKKFTDLQADRLIARKDNIYTTLYDARLKDVKDKLGNPLDNPTLLKMFATEGDIPKRNKVQGLVEHHQSNPAIYKEFFKPTPKGTIIPRDFRSTKDLSYKEFKMIRDVFVSKRSKQILELWSGEHKLKAQEEKVKVYEKNVEDLEQQRLARIKSIENTLISNNRDPSKVINFVTNDLEIKRIEDKLSKAKDSLDFEKTNLEAAKGQLKPLTKKDYKKATLQASSDFSDELKYNKKLIPQLPGEPLPRGEFVVKSKDYSRPIIIYDIETGAQDEILSISAAKFSVNIKTNRLEFVDSFNRFYYHKDLGFSAFNSEAVRINGLTPRVIAEYRINDRAKYRQRYDAKEMQDFLDFIGKGSLIVGQNNHSFDNVRTFHGYLPDINSADTMDIARQMRGTSIGDTLDWKIKNDLEALVRWADWQRYKIHGKDGKKGRTMSELGLSHHLSENDVAATAYVFETMINMNNEAARDLQFVIENPGFNIGPWEETFGSSVFSGKWTEVPSPSNYLTRKELNLLAKGNAMSTKEVSLEEILENQLGLPPGSVTIENGKISWDPSKLTSEQRQNHFETVKKLLVSGQSSSKEISEQIGRGKLGIGDLSDSAVRLGNEESMNLIKAVLNGISNLINSLDNVRIQQAELQQGGGSSKKNTMSATKFAKAVKAGQLSSTKGSVWNGMKHIANSWGPNKFYNVTKTKFKDSMGMSRGDFISKFNAGEFTPDELFKIYNSNDAVQNAVSVALSEMGEPQVSDLALLNKLDEAQGAAYFDQLTQASKDAQKQFDPSNIFEDIREYKKYGENGRSGERIITDTFYSDKQKKDRYDYLTTFAGALSARPGAKDSQLSLLGDYFYGRANIDSKFDKLEKDDKTFFSNIKKNFGTPQKIAKEDYKELGLINGKNIEDIERSHKPFYSNFKRRETRKEKKAQNDFEELQQFTSELNNRASLGDDTSANVNAARAAAYFEAHPVTKNIKPGETNTKEINDLISSTFGHAVEPAVEPAVKAMKELAESADNVSDKFGTLTSAIADFTPGKSRTYDPRETTEAMEKGWMGAFGAMDFLPRGVQKNLLRLGDAGFRQMNIRQSLLGTWRDIGHGSGLNVQDVSGKVGSLIGGAGGNKQAGNIVGQFIGWGINASSQIAGRFNKRKVQNQFSALQSQADMLSIVSDLVITPFKLLGAATKSLMSLFRGLGTSLVNFMESALKSMGGLGTPLTTMTGIGYSQYQGLGALDSLFGFSKGTLNSSFESTAQQAQLLYSTGQFNQDRLIASARLGVFNETYGQNASFEDIVNGLMSQPVTKERMALAGQIDANLPTIMETMKSLGISTWDEYKNPALQGIGWHAIDDEERLKMRKSYYEYSAIQENMGNTKMRAGQWLWSKGGKEIMNGVNEALDLIVSKGDWKGAWEKLKTPIMDVWGRIKTYFGVAFSDNDTLWTKIKKFGEAVWDKISDAINPNQEGEKKGFIDSVKDMFETLWDKVGPTIVKGIKTIEGLWLEGLGKILLKLAPLLDEALSWINRIEIHPENFFRKGKSVIQFGSLEAANDTFYATTLGYTSNGGEGHISFGQEETLKKGKDTDVFFNRVMKTNLLNTWEALSSAEAGQNIYDENGHIIDVSGLSEGTPFLMNGEVVGYVPTGYDKFKEYAQAGYSKKEAQALALQDVMESPEYQELRKEYVKTYGAEGANTYVLTDLANEYVSKLNPYIEEGFNNIVDKGTNQISISIDNHYDKNNKPVGTKVDVTDDNGNNMKDTVQSVQVDKVYVPF